MKTCHFTRARKRSYNAPTPQDKEGQKVAQLKRKISGLPVVLVHISEPSSPCAANDDHPNEWNNAIREWKDAGASNRSLLAEWGRRITDRRLLRRLLDEQPDTVLADAGLTRTVAEREARKPFWIA